MSDVQPTSTVNNTDEWITGNKWMKSLNWTKFCRNHFWETMVKWCQSDALSSDFCLSVCLQNLNAVEACFLPEGEKEGLRRKLLRAYGIEE